MTQYKTYIVTVKHDYGRHKLKVIAKGIFEAREIVMKSEGCPVTAIVHVKHIKP